MHEIPEHLKSIINDFTDFLIEKDKLFTDSAFFGKIGIEINYKDGKYQSDFMEGHSQKR